MTEHDRTLAAFDGSLMVGTAGAYRFQFSVPGAVVPVADVTLVSVLPTHRRRGILRSMMRRRLSDIAERGESLAALWASESMLYRRYGYGKASWHATFTVRHGEGTLLPGAPRDPSLTLRLVEPGEARPDLEKVFETALRSRPGLFARNEDWWDARLYDPESDRGGRTPLHCLLASDEAGTRGYALYSAQPA